MSKERKDNKGRVLKTGESQRSDLIYQYRYMDSRGHRHAIYSSDLRELRQKEKEIQRSLNDGIDYAAGRITVYELLERYISLKRGVRYNTRVGYKFVLNLVKGEAFGKRAIGDIRVSDAQRWFAKLQSDGRGYSTITTVRGVVKPAFQMAYNKDAVRKNPFDFKLSDIVVNDSEKRAAMTPEQQIWMDFIREDKTYRKYYVEKTKTECGCRFLPMTAEVYDSLKNILAARRKCKVETMVDGNSGFILLDKNGKPKVALHIENEMRWALKKYQKLHPDQPLPHITPHVFRHTFCTNMANSGMDVKTLQYLMGHSDVGVTLNVYTHTSYDRAAQQMAKIVPMERVQGAGKQCAMG